VTYTTADALDGNTAKTARQWLTPTAALERVVPTTRAEPSAHAAESAAIRYGYRIGDIGLLVGENVGCEVIPAPPIARIPTTPRWLLGVANLRGGLVPIFDLRALLEVPSGHKADDRFGLIFDRGEHAVGILVSEHPVSLTRLEPLVQPPPLPAAVRDFVATAFHHGHSVWLEFDHRRFFESIAQHMSGSSRGDST
jgi:twitching motility protein PilI